MNNQFPSDSPFYEEHSPDQTQLFDPGLQARTASPPMRQFTEESIRNMIMFLNDARAELDEQIGEGWIQEAIAFIDETLEVLGNG